MAEEMMAEEIMLEKKVWAVVGANDNPEKFGYRIFKKLKSRGYRVYPVNPNYKEIEGDKCYKDLASLPEKPEVIDMVVNPRHGKGIVEEAAQLGIQNIWLQPGTYDDKLLELLKDKGLTWVQACVLVALH